MRNHTWQTRLVRGGIGLLGVLVIVGGGATRSFAARAHPGPAAPAAPFKLKSGGNSGAGITTFTSSVLGHDAWRLLTSILPENNALVYASCTPAAPGCGGVTAYADHVALLGSSGTRNPFASQFDPQTGVYAENMNYTTGPIVYGQSFGKHGIGVQGASPSYDAGIFVGNVGVRGEATAQGSPGLGTIGVLGTSTIYTDSWGGRFYGYLSSGIGVYATSSAGPGVAATSSSGYGLRAQSDAGYALYGTTSAGIGYFGISGVVGQGVSYGGIFTATNPAGVGVVGIAYGFSGPFAVKGSTSAASGSSYGGQFTANWGTGVEGSSSSGTGVRGWGGSGTGVFGHSSTNTAVSGSSYNSAGVYGSSTNGVGVRATSGSSFGAQASSGSGTGLYAVSQSSGPTVYAKNPNAGGYALYAAGDMLVSGSVTTANGGPYIAVTTSQGERTLYTDSATQQVVTDHGTTHLKEGHAIIQINPQYAQAVELGSGYQVFVTPKLGATRGLGVVNKTATSFEIGELDGGHGNFSVDWQIAAVRQGHAGERLAPAQP